MTPLEQAREALQPPLSDGPTWALIERYADAVCEYNTAVRIDVGIDKAGAECLAIEKELRAHLAALSAQEVSQAVPADLLEAVDTLLSEALCDCPDKMKHEDGRHLSGCHLSDLNDARVRMLTAAPAAPQG